MKREKISDAIGGIDPAYVEEAARHRAGSPVWIRWAAAAACVCLIAVAAAALPGLTRPADPPVTDTGTVDPPVTDTNPPIQTPYDPFSDPDILWGENDVSYSEVELPTLANGVSVSWDLLEALQSAGEDRSIAVVVCGTAGSSTSSADSLFPPYSEPAYDELASYATEMEFEMTNVYLDRVEYLAEGMGISREEAQARALSDGEYLSARDSCAAAKAAAVGYYLNCMMTVHGTALEHLEEQGMTLIFDAGDETYHPYLNLYSGLGVMVGTRDEIYALDAGDNEYTLYLASDRAAEYDYLGYNPYIGREIDLPDGSKLTADLQAAYAGNGGAAIPVLVKIAYWGPRYTTREADAIVLRDMGFSSKEDLYANGTEEDDAHFVEQKSRLFYHRDYNGEVAERLTEPGELTQYDEFENYFNCNFYAVLTYERALELAESRDVAYLDLLNGEPEYWADMDTGIWLE